MASLRETSHPIKLQSHLGKCLPEKLFGVDLYGFDVKLRKAIPVDDYRVSCGSAAVRCISSIVPDRKGDAAGVLALMIPLERLTQEMADRFSMLIEEKAHTLGRQIALQE